MTARAIAGAPTRRIALPRILTSEHPPPWLLPVTAMLDLGACPLLYAGWLSLFKRNLATRREIFDPAWNWTKVLFDERVWNASFNA